MGTVADEANSIYLQTTADSSPTQTTQPPGESSTTGTTPAPPPVTADQGDVVVNVTEPPRRAPSRHHTPRPHVAALGLWVVPLAASVIGREYRFSVVAALVGLVLTGITGVGLALWGAPVTFPGLLRWEELAARLYGDAYLIAFLAKMTMVGVAVVATIVWAARRSRLAVLVTFAGLAAEVVAVTAMSQLHLFSHL